MTADLPSPASLNTPHARPSGAEPPTAVASLSRDIISHLHTKLRLPPEKRLSHTDFVAPCTRRSRSSKSSPASNIRPDQNSQKVAQKLPKTVAAGSPVLSHLRPSIDRVPKNWGASRVFKAPTKLTLALRFHSSQLVVRLVRALQEPLHTPSRFHWKPPDSVYEALAHIPSGPRDALTTPTHTLFWYLPCIAHRKRSILSVTYSPSSSCCVSARTAVVVAAAPAYQIKAVQPAPKGVYLVASQITWILLGPRCCEPRERHLHWPERPSLPVHWRLHLCRR